MGIYSTIAPWYDQLFPVSEEQAGFLLDLFAEAGVRSVLDAGCGTGRHLEIFARAGLTIAGLEPEAEMAAAARLRLNALGYDETKAPLRVIGLEETAGAFAETFDAVVCLGNTIAHLTEPSLLRAGLAALAGALRPGGLLVTQTVNFDHVLAESWSPFQDRLIADDDLGELCFSRAYDFGRAPESLGFELALKGKGLHHSETLTLKPYTIAEQREALRSCGLQAQSDCGAWSGAPWSSAAPATILISEREGA